MLQHDLQDAKHVAYLAHGPAGTRFANVQLRIVALRLHWWGDASQLKVVIQTMEGGVPIVSSPIAEAFMTPLELCAYLSQSLRDGWDVAPMPKREFAYVA
ncbi:MAG TPA: hypothetical protein VN436_17885 [Holophaga sp.]|nr:hypothetical protein [Holophaga sp.]